MRLTIEEPADDDDDDEYISIGHSDCITDHLLGGDGGGGGTRLNNYLVVSFALIAHAPARFMRSYQLRADP